MAMGSIYRVSVVGASVYSDLQVCTFHYRADANTILDTQSQDLAEAWFGDLLDLWRALMNVSSLVTRISVRGVTNPTEGFDLPVASVDGVGLLTGDALPPQSAGVITWTTGLVGRRYRGRTYTWQGSESQQAAGQWTSAFTTPAGTFATAARLIGDGLATAEYTLVVHSRTGGIDTPVTSHIIRPYVYTQRRRSLGNGS